MKKYFSIVAFSLALFSCKTATTPQDNSGTTLTAEKIADADAPNVNSSAIESSWNSAGVLTINADKIGTNFPSGSGTSQISIQSVVTSADIYFLAQFDDAESDYLKQPLHFTGGNYNTPSNWILDSNSYEDGFSFVFELPASPGITGGKTFSAAGCAMLCHTSSKDFGNGIRYPGMYPENDGRYDLWFWHAGKGNGCGLADDDVCVGSPVYAHNPDDGNAETYEYNVVGDPDFLPYLVTGGNNENLDKRYFIAKETAVNFGIKNPVTNTLWAAGDKVSSYTVAQPIGGSDYYDVKARGFWSNGKWTVKFHRKLSTGSPENDVQFSSGGQYLFSFAAHNNTAAGSHYGSASQVFMLKFP